MARRLTQERHGSVVVACIALLVSGQQKFCGSGDFSRGWRDWLSGGRWFSRRRRCCGLFSCRGCRGCRSDGSGVVTAIDRLKCGQQGDLLFLG